MADLYKVNFESSRKRGVVFEIESIEKIAKEDENEVIESVVEEFTESFLNSYMVDEYRDSYHQIPGAIEDAISECCKEQYTDLIKDRLKYDASYGSYGMIGCETYMIMYADDEPECEEDLVRCFEGDSCKWDFFRIDVQIDWANIRFYAVQNDDNDDWETGSHSLRDAIDMARDNDYQQISVIENWECVKVLHQGTDF